ncbi:DUF1471 domain-containing protein [Klebsiella pneumoniae]|uniref:DUF1471 domain-containing protein n=1 Tax=Klebsiella pneumoniae TaxID=573 RepID=UPI00226DCF32|nr:DUF1471 domain-containing protein [Klebsiella pneumoniae]MCY0633556.1 DUF1471 domain-containing protein [Klebsiella pneumoniae]
MRDLILQLSKSSIYSTKPSSDSYGEIIGQFNSPDGAVVGATLPGKSVSFSIPVKKHHGQYLHFAFMHAASASEGWFFAPASEQGINLTGLMTEDGKPVDITEQIALFRAPAADQLVKVTADSGKLRLGAAAKFMTAKLTRHNGMFVISIKNISEGDYETPFSSGVWGVTGTAVRSFDHEPSSALSKLATTGHRGELYKLAQKKIPEQNNALSMELTRGAIKMAEEQMAGHKKIGSISGTAPTQGELEKKFAMAAAQMGARYYVITGLSNNNYAFGNADIYE